MQRFLATSLQLLANSGPLTLAFIFLVGTVFILMVGFIAVPIMLVALLAAGIHWYKQKPITTEALQAAIEAPSLRAFPTEDEFLRGAIMRFDENSDVIPVQSIRKHLFKIVRELYRAEDLSNPIPPLAISGDIEEGKHRDRLLDRARKMAEAPRILELMGTSLVGFLTQFTNHLPDIAQDDEEEADSFATMPLLQTVENVGELVQLIYLSFAGPEIVEAGLFKTLRSQLNENLVAASGSKTPVWPNESKLPPDELIETYLAHTPFRFLFDAEVPFKLNTHNRLEHTAIVAGSGWGKTQLLQWMILQDLRKDDPPALVVIDSTGQMTERIQRLAEFNDRLRDRILIIDPAHSPALNMFDISTERLAKYTPEQREDIQTEIISLFNYIFASDDYDLSARMGTAFAYAVRLILSRRGSTITELRQLLEENLPPGSGYNRSAFREDIEKLPQDAREFFATHFFATGFYGTRLNIAQRIHKVIGVPAFRRMFTSGTNVLDLFNDMQKGTIVLVNTNQQLLKDDSYVLFGRYIIARVLAAAFERATLPPEERKETYLIIDEAAPYFDKNFEALLTRVRQFRLGVVIAFQHLEQAPEKLKSAIASSTSVKFAGGLGYMDRRWLAREMETSPEFIGSLKKDGGQQPRFTRFATFVRNYTPHAVAITVPIGLLERQPKMDQAAYAAMLRANLARVAPQPLRSEPPSALDPVSAPDPEPPPNPPAAEASPAPPATPMADADDLPTTWGDDKIR